MTMDSFIVYALIAGIGVAVFMGPLGVFIVWRRMAYFGDSVAHSALLGIALGVLLDVDLTAGIVAVCLAMALMFVFLRQRNGSPKIPCWASWHTARLRSGSSRFHFSPRCGST